MKTITSPLAQNVPVEVVRQIVLKAVAITRLHSSCRQNHEPANIQALLSVCRIWRAAALPVYGACVAVFAEADKKSLCCARNGLSATKAIALGWQPFVRRIVILASSFSLTRGETRKTICNLCNVFENAKFAKLHILGQVGRGLEAYGQHVSHAVEVGSLFEAIGLAFPVLRKVEFNASSVWIGSTTSAITAVPKPHDGPGKEASIYKSIVSMDITSCPGIMFSSSLMPMLTVLVLNILHSNLEHCAALIHQQAVVLERLDVNYIQASDCQAIIQDRLGQKIVYPYLKSLRLDVLGAYSDTDSSNTARIAMPAGASFPAVEFIDCGSFYPFPDGILWYGAEKVLRKLIIAIDVGCARWLFPDNSNTTELLPGPLAKCTMLASLEVRVITRTDISDMTTKAIHERVLTASFGIPQLDKLCLCYPNAHIAEYKKEANVFR